MIQSLGVALVLFAIAATPLLWSPSITHDLSPGARTQVRHVVEIMMENHAFDNLFGKFPGAIGLPVNVSLPNGSGGYAHPYWIQGDSTPDVPHDRATEIADLDNGRMDGFVEENRLVNPATAPELPMGYYNATQIGGYWSLAREFTLCDMYFAPVLGPTDPNRLYAIAGDSAGMTSNQFPSNGVTLTTIFDQLSGSGLPWKYYYQPAPYLPIPLEVSPLRDTPAETQNVVPLSSLLADIEGGNLPAVTFVDPSDSNLSEHPPNNVTAGELWSLSVISAIEASPAWNSTAIFLTWDEGGGFYDGVVPPMVDSLGDGFRVPMIVISPFSQGHGIDSTVFDHTSVLKFIEENWGLPYLNSRIAGANSMMLSLGGIGSPSPPLSQA